MAAKIVLGNHGTPDLVLHKETEVHEVLPDGTIRTVFFHPEMLGLKPDAAVYSLGGLAQWAGELAKPGFGALGPVLEYHLAFLRYVTGASSPLGERAARFQQAGAPDRVPEDGIA